MRTNIRTIYLLVALFFHIEVQAQSNKILLFYYPYMEANPEKYMGDKIDAICSFSAKLGFISRNAIDSIYSIKHLDNPLIEGGAFTFRVNYYQTAQFDRDTAQFRKQDYFYVPLDVINHWNIDSLETAYNRKGKKLSRRNFSAILDDLTDGNLKEGKSVPYGGKRYSEEYSGLIPYTYRGKPCFLLWDDWMKLQSYHLSNDFSRTGSGQTQYSLPYDFQDVRQIVLCRYSENCYVLLFLTHPMVAMD